MKTNRIFSHVLSFTAVLALAAISPSLQASPYATGLTVTNNGAGVTNVQFFLNEAGGNVTVTYENGSTNVNYNGITAGTNLGKGQFSFSLSGHYGYAIKVFKVGNGTPFQISDDHSNFACFATPRGMAVNQDPKNGRWFGRIYCGSGGITGIGTPQQKYHGLYAMNADLSDALGQGTNAFAQGIFGSESSSAPYKMRVAPDDSLMVEDYSGNGALYKFAPDLNSSNAIFLQSQPAGIHGDMLGTPDLLITNIGGTNYWTLWIFDSGMGVPAGTTLGPGTIVGNYNCAYRYDLGNYYTTNSTWAGVWTNPPNYAFTVGLSGISELRIEGDIGKDGKIICGFQRANLSNPNVQVLSADGTTYLWDSWHDTGGATDPWNGLVSVGSAVGGTYGGIRVSPDGLYLAAVDVQNGFTIANLTNGIPDDSSLVGISDAATAYYSGSSGNTGNSRGMDWDAADNLYECSSGQFQLRIFSLGVTTTCITSNDITGTNGTFQLILPQYKGSVVAAQNGSQNYINNAQPGTPIPGIFTVTLNTNNLSAPVAVNFALSGSAVYNTNYTINLGADPNNVIITSTNVTFPAGTYPGVGNWQANVQIIPKATPVSGPTLGVTMGLRGSAQSSVASPSTASLVISNTGPQLLIISALANAATMSRAVPNDYAEFVITRWGDLNGPGNGTGGVNQVSYTVTNFNYSGTGVYPGDYTAQAQNLQTPPQNGQPGITIAPDAVSVTNIIGNPVAHANLNQAPNSVSIIIGLTNALTGTNCTSSEGLAYAVTTAATTLTELDDTIGPEVVLWSDALTSSSDSTNWTLTFAATNRGAGPTLPVVIPNYTNDETAIVNINGGTNDFRVEFGNPISADSVPQSPYMAAHGLTTALHMTVNKDHGNSQAGVNLYPQGVNFAGNYALRFSMYLSMYSGANNNPFAGTYPFEFALFGVNHRGTNCNWRTSFNIPPGAAYDSPTNADGVWFAIDAGWGSITPADFDAFTSPALPNGGVTADYQSSSSAQESGVFKSPPFTSMQAGAKAGGQPIDQWVDVSVEITSQTNVSVYINRSKVIPSFVLTNGGGNYVSGVPMLGYLDPVPDESDSSAFVYYSNVRVVELSPYITAHPVSLIATQGANVSFTSSAWLGTAPVSNTWYLASTPTNPVTALQTDVGTTNLTSTLALNNVQAGTNYLAVFRDVAGSVTGAVAQLEVIIGPTNRTVNAGSNFVQFVAIPSGPSAPTAYQWKTNGVNLANGNHFAGVATAALTLTNAQLADAVTYTCFVTNAAGSVAVAATLVVSAPQPAFSNIALSGTNALLNFSTTDPFDNTGSFTLQSSGNVQGPYTNTTTATITGSAGSFQFKVPLTTNTTIFYRLKHN
jgi:hypothetical protein